MSPRLRAAPTQASPPSSWDLLHQAWGEGRGEADGTFFLKSLSSLPGFSCHRKKRVQSLLPGFVGFSPLYTQPHHQFSL